MSLFRKHQKEEERMPQYNYFIPPIKFRDDFFLSLDALTSQAEFHFKNKNYELSEGIFELMIKHIEKNKSIRLVEEGDPISKIIREKRKGKINDEFPCFPKDEPTN